MHNRRIEAARRFHALTKLAPPATGARVNAPSQSRLFRPAGTYPDLPSVPLPRDFSFSHMPTLSAVAATEWSEERAPSVRELASALFALSRKTAGVETYLVCADLAGLHAGIYCFHREGFALRRLRSGDYRPELAGAAGDNQAVAAAPVTVVLSARFDRIAGHDELRVYRHRLLECGAATAAILTVMAAREIPCSIEMGFVDSKINYLLGLDGRAESSVCLVPLGRSIEWAGHAVGREIPPLSFPSSQMISPGAGEMQAASALLDDAEIRPWRGPCIRAPASPRNPSRHLSIGRQESLPLSEMMAHQDFRVRRPRPPLTIAGLSALLLSSTHGVPADFLEGPETSLVDVYVGAFAVEGLDPGAYFFSPAARSLEDLKIGALREQAGRLFPAGSAVEHGALIFLLSDLGAALERFGNRGYRALHLEGGILGERFSLCARSLNLEATSLPFYDDEVVALLSPQAAGKEAIFALALGQNAGIAP